MAILKSKLITVDDLDVREFTDFYFNSNSIDAFYIPEIDEEMGDLINIYISGEAFTIKQELHITDYLMNNFVEPSIKTRV